MLCVWWSFEMAKEAVVMSGTITYCMDNPIETNLVDWLNEHLGRVSVGKECKDHYEILAYSDQRVDFPELYRMARENKAKYINSVISDGVTTID